MDIEEGQADARQDAFHVFVADVIKSFDTVDRGILDCVLDHLGVPGCFRKVSFAFHAQVRSTWVEGCYWLGVPWTRERVPSHVAPHIVPWFRYLEILKGVHANFVLRTSNVLLIAKKVSFMRLSTRQFSLEQLGMRSPWEFVCSHAFEM